MAYSSRQKKNLPIYGVKSKDLREFATTEKDRDKGISRIPLALSRLREEDVIKEEEEILIMETQESYTSNMEHRSKAIGESRSSSTADYDFDLEKYREGRSSTLYSKSSIGSASYEDFEIKSILGKGTFGKVNLR